MSRAWLPSVVILLFVIAYLGSGYLTLDPTTRSVPLMVGVVTLSLLVIDMLRSAFSGSSAATVDEHTVSAPPRRELTAIAYVAGVVAAVYLFGFLLAIPVYLFAATAYLGKESIRTALTVALLTSLTLYLLFVVVLEYQLYPGMLFA